MNTPTIARKRNSKKAAMKYEVILTNIHFKATNGLPVNFETLSREYKIGNSLRLALSTLGIISVSGRTIFWQGAQPSRKMAIEVLNYLHSKRDKPKVEEPALKDVVKFELSTPPTDKKLDEIHAMLTKICGYLFEK